MKLLSKPERLTVTGHRVSTLEKMSLKRLSKVTQIPRATLHYRINVMNLTIEEAVNHERHQWVNGFRSAGKRENA